MLFEKLFTGGMQVNQGNAVKDIRPLAERLGKDVHFFKIFEENVVIDAESGSLHLVDDLTMRVFSAGSFDLAELVGMLPAEAPAQLSAVLDEVKNLVLQGSLFAEAAEAPRLCGPEDEVKALCLNVAHACNMRCGYCFACDGTYGQSAAVMKPDVACAAIDFLFRASKGRKHMEVDFFGGEPLLALDTVKAAVAYGQNKAASEGRFLKFTLTTNGLSLDKKTGEYLNQQNMSAVLSLDGREVTHDRMRRTPDGAGTYRQIAHNIQDFVNSRDGREYYVRGTYTRENLDFAKDVIHLAELGFEDVSVEPAVDFDNSAWGIQAKDLAGLREEYKRLAEYCLQRRRQNKPLNFFHFNVAMTDGPCAAKRASGCGAGTQYLAVDPNGGLWPCHQFVGQEEFYLGDIFTGLQNDAIRDSFRHASLLNKAACRDCWARYYCGGGCHANAWSAGKNLMQPYQIGCELMKMRLECALALQAQALIDSQAD